MASDESTDTKPARRSIRSGTISLSSSVILVVWLAIAVWIMVPAQSNAAAGVVATIMFVASWVLVPILIVAVLVFGIIALLLNPVIGKIMGAIGIVLPVIAAALFWNSIGGFSEAFLG